MIGGRHGSILRDRRSQLYLTAVCFLIGMLVVMQLRTQSRLNRGLQSPNSFDQGVIIANLVDANAQLSQEVNQIDAKLQEYQRTSGRTDVDVLVQDINRLKLINGLVEASGPGVHVTVNGTLAVTDMQDLINELRNAGSEAISLNGHRVVFRSVVSGDIDGLRLDGVPVQPPFELRAIGQPETLERALERKGGLVQLFRYNHPDRSVAVAIDRRLVLPIYEGQYSFTAAQIAKP